MSLKTKTVKGVIWNAIELFGGQFVQFVVTIILARILVPEDFGVIGLLVIFMGVSTAILDSGFSQALIRKQDTNNEDYTSIFYFNIVIGIVIYIILFVTSPLISSFYRFPELTNIARVSFLAIIINSFGVVQNAKIIREVKFKILAKRTVIANALAGILAIGLASKGYGVWALVMQSLFASFLRVALLWNFSKWHPSLNFSFEPIKKMLPFSINLMFSGVLDVIVTNIQTLLIGKFYTRADLGYYTQAKRLESIPSNTLTAIVRNVTYPILSTIQDNVEQLKQAYRKIIGVTLYFVFPLMVGLMAAGDNLISVLFGPKWAPAVDYFIPLCLMGAIFPLYSINLNIFLVRGRGDIFFKVNVAKRIVTLAAVILAVPVSVYAIVWGQVIAALINTLITMVFSGKEIKYKFTEQLKDIALIVICSVIMAVCVFLTGYLLSIKNPLFVLILQMSVALMVYLILSKLFVINSYFEIKDIVFGLLRKS